MKQTLINKYLAGETSISEERELRQLLLDTPDAQRSKSERSILELLSYSGNEDMEEDIFAVDYTEEYDKHVRPSRTIRLWPWLVAACVAGLFMIVLTPPKEAPLCPPEKGEDNMLAKVEQDTISIKEEVQETPSAIVSKQITKRTIAKHTDAKAEENAVDVPEIAESENNIASTEKPQASDDLFASALSNVRQATLEKMMSCDMQCMNEEIQSRGNRLAILINEQQ